LANNSSQNFKDVEDCLSKLKLRNKNLFHHNHNISKEESALPCFALRYILTPKRKKPPKQKFHGLFVWKPIQEGWVVYEDLLQRIFRGGSVYLLRKYALRAAHFFALPVEQTHYPW
jgi:hypothetical protein